MREKMRRDRRTSTCTRTFYSFENLWALSSYIEIRRSWISNNSKNNKNMLRLDTPRLTGFRHKHSEARWMHDEEGMHWLELFDLRMKAETYSTVPKENSPKALTNFFLFVKRYWLQYTKMQLMKIEKV